MSVIGGEFRDGVDTITICVVIFFIVARMSKLVNLNNPQERYQILYHVVFEFLEHVVISHNEFLCCAAIRYVGKDTQSLTDEKNTNAVKLCVFQKRKKEILKASN